MACKVSTTAIIATDLKQFGQKATLLSAPAFSYQLTDYGMLDALQTLRHAPSYPYLSTKLVVHWCEWCEVLVIKNM